MHVKGVTRPIFFLNQDENLNINFIWPNGTIFQKTFFLQNKKKMGWAIFEGRAGMIIYQLS
jgi:hypothetical protein